MKMRIESIRSPDRENVSCQEGDAAVCGMTSLAAPARRAVMQGFRLRFMWENAKFCDAVYLCFCDIFNQLVDIYCLKYCYFIRISE
jgi:hypothetical protein